jgi:hypothetical protein
MMHFTNAQAFRHYRHELPGYLRRYTDSADQSGPNDFQGRLLAKMLDGIVDEDNKRLLATMHLWAARYSARGNAIASLEDAAAAAALMARNRARDAAEPMAEGLWGHASVFVPSLFGVTMAATRERGDAGAAADPTEEGIETPHRRTAADLRRARRRGRFSARRKDAGDRQGHIGG